MLNFLRIWRDVKYVEKVANFFGRHYIIYVVSVAEMVFFMVSVVTTWPSPMLPKLYENEDNRIGRPITPDEADLIASSYAIGLAIGPLLCIDFVGRIGRKKMLILLSLFLPISFVNFAFAKKVEILYIFRVVVGIFVGGVLSIIPIYLSEIIKFEEINFFMSFATVFGFAGALFTYSIGPYIPLVYFNLLAAFLAIILIILFAIGCPESPYDIIRFKGRDDTRDVLKFLRFDNFENELEKIVRSAQLKTHISRFEIFKSFRYIEPFILATTPLLIQVFSGAGVVQTYTELIFQQTNITLSFPVCSIIIGVMQLLTSFLPPLLYKSKKTTLKSLFLLCLIGIMISDLILSYYFFFAKSVSSLQWLPLFGLLVFVVFFNCGMDSLPWIVLGRMYPKDVDRMGTALSTVIFGLANFPFLFLFNKIKISHLFLASAICAILGIIYALFVFREPGKDE